MSQGKAWPIGIGVVLGLTIAGNLVVMRIANDDPAFAIEPDYYRRAVHFDETMARQAESLRLGWSATVTVDPVVTGQPTHVAVTLRDAASAPLTGAKVGVVARFNARANDTLIVTLRPGEDPGVYAATLPIRTPGVWELRVEAVRDRDRYSTTARLEVVRAGVGRGP